MTKLLESLVQYNKVLSRFGQQQLVMVNYACGFNQSQTGKYFEGIIIVFSVLHKAACGGFTKRQFDYEYATLKQNVCSSMI